MKFDFFVLGANSATPLPDRFPSSFVVSYGRQAFLLDCGEGAQIKMSQYSVKRSLIDHILLSHLHGDHVFGLPGLLNSFSLNSRKNPLKIIGPLGIKDFVLHILKSTYSLLGYELIFLELKKSEIQEVFLSDELQITAFPLKHRIPTFGYLFRERRANYKIQSPAIDQYQLTVPEIQQLKKGIAIQRQDQWLPIEKIVEYRAPRSFAYCTDTVYDESLIPILKDVNVLYHEATYLHEMAEVAHERMHSTSMEAALIAKAAGVGTLILGHYSGRYRHLEPLLLEAQSIFAASCMAIEGTCFEVSYPLKEPL